VQCQVVLYIAWFSQGGGAGALTASYFIFFRVDLVDFMPVARPTKHAVYDGSIAVLDGLAVSCDMDVGRVVGS
jgi:hypothetical protein